MDRTGRWSSNLPVPCTRKYYRMHLADAPNAGWILFRLEMLANMIPQVSIAMVDILNPRDTLVMMFMISMPGIIRMTF